MPATEGPLQKLSAILMGDDPPPPMVLVVDDDIDSVVTVSHMLRAGGYKPGMATDTTKALALLREYPYRLIIADLWMPDTDGITFLRQARRIRPGIPAIVMTARGDWDTYMEALEDGIREYLSKPVKKSDLLATVARSIADAPA